MRVAVGLAGIVLALSVVASVSAANPTWSDLAMGPDLDAIRSSADLRGRRIATVPVGPLSVPGVDEHRLAYCGSDAIWRSLDGGLTWSQVPVGPVAAASGSLPLAQHRDGTPVCQSVTLDPADPDTYYAVFQALRPGQGGPPPWFAAGFSTRDAGQTWQPVPAPDGADPGQFAGFEAHPDGVQAIWQPVSTGPANGQVQPPRLLVTTDSGTTWQPAAFGCPATGPCIRWGAPPSRVGPCAMHADVQPLLVSADGGQTWRAPVGGAAVDACTPSHLAILSDTDVLLLAPGSTSAEPSPVPARLSRDGGQTFVPLALPGGLPDPGPRELALLPGGQLLALARDADAGWRIANPGAEYWCDVATAALPREAATLGLSGDRLWWLGPTGVPMSVPLADLGCAGPLLVPSTGPLSGPDPTATPRS